MALKVVSACLACASGIWDNLLLLELKIVPFSCSEQEKGSFYIYPDKYKRGHSTPVRHRVCLVVGTGLGTFFFLM